MTTQPPSLESYPLVSLEPANLGLPSGLDLFDKEYSWYIATGNLGSEVGDIGHSLLQSCRASASFFLIPEKRVEASEVLFDSWSIKDSVDPNSKTQQDLNHVLSQVAILSRATYELGHGRYQDSRLQGLRESAKSSYKQYKKELGSNKDRDNIAIMMTDFTRLASVVSELTTGLDGTMYEYPPVQKWSHAVPLSGLSSLMDTNRNPNVVQSDAEVGQEAEQTASDGTAHPLGGLITDAQLGRTSSPGGKLSAKHRTLRELFGHKSERKESPQRHLRDYGED